MEMGNAPVSDRACRADTQRDSDRSSLVGGPRPRHAMLVSATNRGHSRGADTVFAGGFLVCSPRKASLAADVNHDRKRPTASDHACRGQHLAFRTGSREIAYTYERCLTGETTMSPVLEQYRKQVMAETGLDFPRFACGASHEARILSILETPYRSGAFTSGECALTNADPTARRTKRLMTEAGVQEHEVVFWNFYAAYEPPDPRRAPSWARRIERLIEVLPWLETILVFGNRAWLGMRFACVPRSVQLVWSPHPSNRALNGRPDRERLIALAWRRAAESGRVEGS